MSSKDEKKMMESDGVESPKKDNDKEEKNANIKDSKEEKEEHVTETAPEEDQSQNTMNEQAQEERESGTQEPGSEKKPLETVKEEIEKVAEEGWQLLKKAFGRVKEISSDATELTKLKLEHKKLLDKKEEILLRIGTDIWEKQKKGEKIDLKDFEEQFAQLTTLEKEIEDLKSKIENIKILQ